MGGCHVQHVIGVGAIKKIRYSFYFWVINLAEIYVIELLSMSSC